MSARARPKLLKLGVAALACSIGIAAVAPPSGANSPDDRHRIEWQERYRDVLQRADSAHIRHADAKAAYRDGRQRKRLRGERKRAVLEEIRQAEIELQAAEEALEAFPDQALHAGVLPGWLRAVRQDR